MPALNADIETIADVIQEVITSLEATADQLGKKQPGRHAERACQAITFDVNQLASVLPALRDFLRPAPATPFRAPQPIIPASTDISGETIGG